MVRALPSGNAEKENKAFLHDLSRSLAQTVRPCLVLDLGAVHRADGALVELLLCCLEEALKRNGDARLSGARAHVARVLDSIGLRRLFQFFATTEQAVNSYQRPSLVVEAAAPRDNANRPYESAA